MHALEQSHYTEDLSNLSFRGSWKYCSRLINGLRAMHGNGDVSSGMHVQFNLVSGMHGTTQLVSGTLLFN